ncbi:phosphotransferase [Phytoactinopolyspora endophytica]|uniref:phosphotransferase n=1 Tax=Phytoactinopolyspora endophytica TaxID=1642495 RepID=UPI00197B7DF9|nr:phosphotransferase [Phytoactinopolyspora endophytica]
MTSADSAVPIPVAGGARAAWTDIPEQVRSGIEELLGSPVVDAVNQDGGFSPGMAARVRCADGSRVFVKAVGASLNPHSPGIFRAEASIARQLPAAAPVPALRASYDDGDWVALVFDEVDGRTPSTPWQPNELERVVRAVTELSLTLTPCPIDDVPTASERLATEMLCYRELAMEPPADLDPWERRHLGRLADLSESALEHLAGDTLVHLDLRADNILLDDDRVWIVDWPWACRGAAWIDSVMLQMNAALHGHDPEEYLDRHPLLVDVDPDHVTAFLAGLCGFLGAYSRRPAPPGLPTIREFQRAQHASTLAWLRRRTDWP